MATIKYKQNGTTYSCWSSTGRVTTPSLCFKDGSTTKYVPLFAVNNGAEGSSGNYYFKVGGLCAKYNNTTYRAALSRRYASSVSNTISTTITHSGKTGTSTSTSTESKTIVKTGSIIAIIDPDAIGGPGGTGFKAVYVPFGVTFASPPTVHAYYGPNVVVRTITTTGCTIVPDFFYAPGQAVSYYLEIIGQALVTTTTYPSETKSATASGNFNYGVTYPSAPSLTVNSGGVTATNNSGNASFKASKSLSGTVAYGKSATLSQAFKVSFTGAI